MATTSFWLTIDMHPKWEINSCYLSHWDFRVVCYYNITVHPDWCIHPISSFQGPVFSSWESSLPDHTLNPPGLLSPPLLLLLSFYLQFCLSVLYDSFLQSSLCGVVSLGKEKFNWIQGQNHCLPSLCFKLGSECGTHLRFCSCNAATKAWFLEDIGAVWVTAAKPSTSDLISPVIRLCPAMTAWSMST